MSLCGHVIRMGDNRKLKTVMFEVMEGENKRGRRHREWADDIEDWGEGTRCRNCTIWLRIETDGDGESSGHWRPTSATLKVHDIHC